MAPRDIMKDSNQQFAQSEAQSIQAKKKKPRRLFSKFINLLLIVAVLALGYGYYAKKKELDTIKDPAAQAEVAKKAAQDVAAQASRVVLLPEGDEVPEVLTINNAELAIKEQPNLAGVVTGDKILLYIKSGKAIVYSPSRNIIVTILPVTLQRPAGQGATSNQTPPAANNNDDDDTPARTGTSSTSR